MFPSAKKRFGQNFLTDQFVIQNIIKAIQPTPEQEILEIGPGLGAITIPLLQETNFLTVVELDRDIIPILKQNCKAHDNLTIIQADILKVKLDEIELPKKNNIRIVGNLPYNISTPILFYLMQYHKIIMDMHFMLQKEVVDRMAAKPGSKTYGRLSVMLQYYCDIENLFSIPADAFTPAPKVTSALVKLTPYNSPKVDVNNLKDFSELVTQAFSQRRKTLRNCLKKLLNFEQIIECGIDPGIRAEQLSLQEFAFLSNFYSNLKLNNNIE